MRNIGVAVVFTPVLVVAMGIGCGSSKSASKSESTGGGDHDGAGGEASAPPPEVDGGGVSPPAATCAAPIQAVDVSNPTTVVGTGTAPSCTEAALSAALTHGGVVTFDCGSAGATITVTKTVELPTGIDTVIDGGGVVTIDGGGNVRILDWNSPNYRANTHKLTLQHVTFAHGHATGTMPIAAAPAPCSSGYYGGAGGALQMRDGVLNVIDANFLDNQAEQLGPDVGGGAIYLNGGLDGVVVGSTFLNNSASNSGAIGSLNSDLDVYNSTFQGNAALGFGANSNDSTMCSVVDANNQNQVGSGGNAGAIGMDGGSDVTHTFCGDTFRSNSSGKGALGGALARTPDAGKQTTVIDRCLFDGNTGDSAGAAYFHNSTLTITASTFTGNVGQTGIGTIQADGTTFDFTNVTFYGNHATTGVGATLALFGGDGTLLNCTFADNQCDAANQFGAAIFGSPNLTIQNTLFDGNTAQNPGAPMQCQVGTITGGGDMQWPVDHTNGGGADALCAPGIYEATDPMLGTLGDHGGPVPVALVANGSAALGRGTGCPSTDARGMTRSTTNCTVGAAEGSN
ncbi:MAG: choice-of-anchor Q domain-containing protein [Polyangiaceae bacterium]